MKKSEEKPQKNKNARETDKKQKEGKSVSPAPEDERTGFGILPNRDLKKNLGCG